MRKKLSVLGMALCLACSALGQTAFQFEVAVQQVEDAAEASKKRVFGKYAEAVTRIQKGFQAEGDLANTMKAKNEAKLATEKQLMGNEAFPGVDKLRLVMKKELGKIKVTRLTSMTDTRKRWVGQLEQQTKALTKSDKLGEAVESQKEQEAQQLLLNSDLKTLAQLKGVPAEVATKQPSKEPGARTPEKLRHVKTPLKDDAILSGDIKLSPGIHRLKGRVEIGRWSGDDGVKGFLVAGKETEIKGGEIGIRNGDFNAVGTKFDEVAIAELPAGDFESKSSLFEKCSFRKSGAWGGDFSADWQFEDCVFSVSFFTTWKGADVKIDRCSFHDVDFSPMVYSEEVTWEEVSDGRRITNCYFVNCRVPVSVAVAATNCVFKDCTFVGESKKGFVVTDPIETVLSFEGTAVPEMPKTPEGVTLVFKPLSDSPDLAFGASVDYELGRSGRLSFR